MLLSYHIFLATYIMSGTGNFQVFVNLIIFNSSSHSSWLGFIFSFLFLMVPSLTAPKIGLSKLDWLESIFQYSSLYVNYHGPSLFLPSMSNRNSYHPSQTQIRSSVPPSTQATPSTLIAQSCWFRPPVTTFVSWHPPCYLRLYWSNHEVPIWVVSPFRFHFHTVFMHVSQSTTYEAEVR